MTPNQAAQLKAAIRRLVAAEIDASWSGTGDPDDLWDIEQELESSRKRVDKLIAKHVVSRGAR